MLTLTIKQGKEKSLLDRQPWIYASMIERVDGKAHEKMTYGATVLVRSSSGKFLARAGWSPKSQIRARVWSFDESEPVDHALFKRRIKAAVAARAVAGKNSAVPLLLVAGEQDGLPGLRVDWIGGVRGFLVCQFQAAGVDAWKVPIVQALIAETGCPNAYELSDELVRKAEGLPAANGALAGEEPPASVLATIDAGQALSVKQDNSSRHR